MTKDLPQGKQIPLMDGLFTWPSKKPQLIGNKCRTCGQHYFPISFKCQNPDCMSTDLEKVLISNRGRLWSYTINYFPLPLPFKTPKEGFKPFAVGEVEFPEHIRVAGMIVDINPEKDLEIGMEMELIIDKLYEDENGKEVMGWKFKPL